MNTASSTRLKIFKQLKYTDVWDINKINNYKYICFNYKIFET